MLASGLGKLKKKKKKKEGSRKISGGKVRVNFKMEGEMILKCRARAFFFQQSRGKDIFFFDKVGART